MGSSGFVTGCVSCNSVTLVLWNSHGGRKAVVVLGIFFGVFLCADWPRSLHVTLFKQQAILAEMTVSADPCADWPRTLSVTVVADEIHRLANGELAGRRLEKQSFDY